MSWLIYGAYGYTGRLVVEEARRRGRAPAGEDEGGWEQPVLAGRDPAKLDALAQEVGLPFRVIDLADRGGLEAALGDFDVVAHCAGPFVDTSKPMVDACLRTGTHYLDITGEIDVFEAIAARDREAREARVMLMPGAGFDVVPTDCLAAHLKERLPTATRLLLAFKGIGRMSRGTSRTVLRGLGRGCVVRRGGELVDVPPGFDVRQVDFGRGPLPAVAIPWGDVSTAWYSTGIPDITVYMAQPEKAIRMLRASRWVGPVLRSAFVQDLLARNVKPGGPTDAQRAAGMTLVWGRVEDDAGGHAEARLRCADGYDFTARSVVRIAQKVLAGELSESVGFQTPSGALGADFVLEIEGSEREDLD